MSKVEDVVSALVEELSDCKVCQVDDNVCMDCEQLASYVDKMLRIGYACHHLITSCK